jgi:hypothetical protein
MLRQPLKTELSASVVAASKAGLGDVTPEVLHLGNHTSVRLAPWPIVARIASGSSFDFSYGSISRELTVATHLAIRKAPSVRPLRGAAPGPYLENDCAITLWELVDGRGVATADDELMAAASLKKIHSALADLDTELPSFIAKVESCETILNDPAQATKLEGTDRLFLEELYGVLRRDLNGAGGAWQPLHGDTHIGNVLVSGSGAIWMDLEAACFGPLEWDVVNLPVATWPEFTPVDPSLMRLFADVRSLCLAVWCWAEFDRSPETSEAAIHHLANLKIRFS